MTLGEGPPTRRVPLWTLIKAGQTATCVAQSHPLGLELVSEVDGEIRRTEVVRSGQDRQALADRWRAAFLAKGWMNE